MLEHPPLKFAMDSNQLILMDQVNGDQIIEEPDIEVVTSADHNTVILDNTLAMAGFPAVDPISPQETIVNTSYAEIDDEWHMQMVANGHPDCNNLVTDVTNVTVKTETGDTIADANYNNEMDDEWQMQIQLISLVTDVTVKIENEEIVTESSNDSENVTLTELAAEPEIPLEKQELSEPNVVLIDEDTSSLIETIDMSAPIQVIAAEELENTYFDVGIQTIGEEYTVTDDVSSLDDSDSDTPSPVSKTPADVKHLNSFNVCNVCNKEFFDRSACQRHMIAAHEEAKYQCTKCDKNFYRAYSLKIHIKKKHNGEGLYFCDKCNNCFSCKFYYDQHRKRNCTPVQCCDCGRGMANMLQLQIHRRRVHKK